MLFLIGFSLHVAATFAFVLAILTPNWLSFINSGSNSTVIVQRGVFYVCKLLSSNNAYVNTQCLSIIEQSSSNEVNIWLYNFAVASASLAIACAGLSIIIIWLSGIYFQVRRRTKNASCFLLCIILLDLVIFFTSAAVWILLISETLKLGISIDRYLFNWPMWLAIGATGGYLLALIILIASFCSISRRKNKVLQNYYRPRNQF